MFPSLLSTATVCSETWNMDDWNSQHSILFLLYVKAALAGEPHFQRTGSKWTSWPNGSKMPPTAKQLPDPLSIDF